MNKKARKKCKAIDIEYSSKILEKIGLIISRFQKLECSMIKLASVLLDKPQENRRLIDLHQMSFKDLIVLMISVSSKTKWNYHKKLIKLSKLAIKSEKEKNQIISSLWYTQGWAMNNKSLNKKTDRVKSIVTQHNVNDLKDIAKTINIIDSSIDALIFKYIMNFPV